MLWIFSSSALSRLAVDSLSIIFPAIVWTYPARNEVEEEEVLLL